MSDTNTTLDTGNLNTVLSLNIPTASATDNKYDPPALLSSVAKWIGIITTICGFVFAIVTGLKFYINMDILKEISNIENAQTEIKTDVAELKTDVSMKSDYKSVYKMEEHIKEVEKKVMEIDIRINNQKEIVKSKKQPK